MFYFYFLLYLRLSPDPLSHLDRYIVMPLLLHGYVFDRREAYMVLKQSEVMPILKTLATDEVQHHVHLLHASGFALLKPQTIKTGTKNK